VIELFGTRRRHLNHPEAEFNVGSLVKGDLERGTVCQCRLRRHVPLVTLTKEKMTSFTAPYYSRHRQCRQEKREKGTEGREEIDVSSSTDYSAISLDGGCYIGSGAF